MVKKIFIISPVRHITPEFLEGVKATVQSLEAAGHKVYWPYRDTPQNDKTGLNICRTNLKAIKEADIVYIAWDSKSQGSLFDLGMAFALGKTIIPIVGLFPPPTPYKSFASMVHALEAEQFDY